MTPIRIRTLYASSDLFTSQASNGVYPVSPDISAKISRGAEA
jgi:hypothetical protein